MEIRIVGPGCARCKRALREAEKAVALAGVDATVSRSERLEDLLAFRTAATPALIVDGVLRSAGRVPRTAEIASWLRPACLHDARTAPQPVARKAWLPVLAGIAATAGVVYAAYWAAPW